MGIIHFAQNIIIVYRSIFNKIYKIVCKILLRSKTRGELYCEKGSFISGQTACKYLMYYICERLTIMTHNSQHLLLSLCLELHIFPLM